MLEAVAGVALVADATVVGADDVDVGAALDFVDEGDGSVVEGASVLEQWITVSSERATTSERFMAIPW
jgi:hypothetical protein